MESGRPVRLSAAMRSASRLIGFPDALARLSGTRPGALRGRAAFMRACAAVADPALAGPVRLRAVAEGRRTVGHAVDGDASVRLLAAACLRHRSAEAVLVGPLVPRLARSAGIRPPIRRRWSADPALDARAQAALDDAHLWFGVRCIEAPPGAAWTSALLVPQLLHLRPASCPPPAEAGFAAAFADDFDFGDPLPAGRAPDEAAADWTVVHEAREMPRLARPHPHPDLLDGHARAVSALVLLAGDITRTLVVPDLPGSRTAAADAAAEEASLAERIAAAVAAAPSQDPRPPAPQVETGFRDGASAILLALAGHADLPEELGARLAAALPFQLSRRASSAAAVFRRTLPADLRDIAGLVGHRFEGSQQACCFLRAHEGFTPQDNRRVLEAFRLMGCLRPYHDRPEVLDAIRGGGTLDAVLAAAVGRPLHRKTVRSLRVGVFGRGLDHRAANETPTFCGQLDAYFATDPHLPALTPAELGAAYRISGMATGLPYGHFPGPQVAAAFRAHLDAKGRLRPPSPGEEDLLRWLVDRCRIAFGGARARGDLYTTAHVHVRQAAAILYPPQRRHAALARLDAAWHRDVVRLTHEHDMLVAELRSARGRRRTAPPAFPHLAREATEIGGVRLTPLVGSDAIAAEGRDLQHCIGTYVGHASTGGCMLLGLASEAGRSSAEIVATLREGRKGAHLVVRQHYGPRNGVPPEGHVVSLRAWIDAADPKAVLAAARIAVDASRSRHDTFDPYAGIGPEGRRRIAALCREQLAPYLSGALKSASPEDWAAL